ncbi:LEA type 2 family protein [candidate division KSB1 bacterium]|nr:LEA type 2 family protein [candidate division KSB1 bacterium]
MKRHFLPIFLCVICLLAGCSVLQELVQIQKPRVSVSDAKLTGLNFDGVDLLLTFQIDNPNSLGVTANGFDYDFKLNGNSFVQGKEIQTVSVPANGTGQIDLPISILFKDIYQAVNSLKNQDSTEYEISAGFNFNLPVLGPIRVPVTKKGSLPLLKLPKVSIQQFKVSRMGFTGADLELVLGVKNPNSIPFKLKAMQYDFSVNQLNWAKGSIPKAISLAQKGEGSVTIPISLDFLKMGQSIVQLIKGNSELDYQLKGALDLGSDLSILGDVHLPLDQAGKVKLSY